VPASPIWSEKEMGLLSADADIDTKRKSAAAKASASGKRRILPRIIRQV
jgi:hypothetical protein